MISIAASCITRSPLVSTLTLILIGLKLMTELYPPSALMGVGIASTIVPHVRNDYNDS